jgi:adenine-specific DNA-methyltransferase
MSEERPEKVELSSMSDLERIEALRDLLPEAFIDNVFDAEAAAETLGLPGTRPKDRYGLSWAGKDTARESLRQRSVATLRPDHEKSIDFDAATNLFIEGDNLEVLRLLQRPYGNRVRMIYIDPPYNTGSDFIYKDDFRHGLDAYLRFTGQLDENGQVNGSNGETAGRYHSQWLTMMYPRVALARNLLRRDGVIFVSIDDHEVHNLRLLLDEVFGPENFVASVIWQKVFSPKSSARHFSEDHDYVLVYARDAIAWTPNLLPRTAEQDANYSNPDDDPRGPWMSSDLSARNYYSRGTYPIETPAGRIIEGPPAGMYWRYSEDAFRELDADDRIWWGREGDGQPRIKRFLSEVLQGRVPQTLWKHEDAGHNQEAKKEVLERVQFADSDSVFDTPKPTRLIRRMLTLATDPESEDIVLDFFAGSGTTADAVLQANAEDGGNRRFICVQAPEKTGYEDYETVADIARTRIAAAREEMSATLNGASGIRDLVLGKSNFRVWDGEGIESGEELSRRIEAFVVSLEDDATDDGIVIEMMLAEGLSLDLPLDRREIDGSNVVLVGPEGRRTAICLDREFTPEFEDVVLALIAEEVDRVILLDIAFTERDEALLNAYYKLKAAGITLRTV